MQKTLKLDQISPPFTCKHPHNTHLLRLEPLMTGRELWALTTHRGSAHNRSSSSGVFILADKWDFEHSSSLALIRRNSDLTVTQCPSPSLVQSSLFSLPLQLLSHLSFLIKEFKVLREAPCCDYNFKSLHSTLILTFFIHALYPE